MPEDTTDGTLAPEATPPVAPAPDTLGDAGKKALDDERAARKTAEKAAKDAAAELDKLRKASMNDQEKAVAEAEARGRAAMAKELGSARLRDRIELAASGKLANPRLASGLLGETEKFLRDDGSIDEPGIASAIDALLKTDPYLAPSARPGPLPGGGAKPAEGLDMDAWFRSQVSAKR